jgi:hypothetical protein
MITNSYDKIIIDGQFLAGTPFQKTGLNRRKIRKFGNNGPVKILSVTEKGLYMLLYIYLQINIRSV